MKKTKKHAAPLRCRLEVWLRGPSPSRMICCRIGCRGYTGAKHAKHAKCQDCEENIARAACDGIIEALDRLARNASAAAITLEIAAKNAKEASQAEE